MPFEVLIQPLSYNLYQKPANGAKDEEVLLKSNGSKTPTSWSRDGRFLLYTELDPKTKNDVWVLLEGRKPMPFLRSAFNEDQGRFSPDGRAHLCSRGRIDSPNGLLDHEVRFVGTPAILGCGGPEVGFRASENHYE